MFVIEESKLRKIIRTEYMQMIESHNSDLRAVPTSKVDAINNKIHDLYAEIENLEEDLEEIIADENDGAESFSFEDNERGIYKYDLSGDQVIQLINDRMNLTYDRIRLLKQRLENIGQPRLPSRGKNKMNFKK